MLPFQSINSHVARRATDSCGVSVALLEEREREGETNARVPGFRALLPCKSVALQDSPVRRKSPCLVGSFRARNASPSTGQAMHLGSADNLPSTERESTARDVGSAPATCLMGK